VRKGEHIYQSVTKRQATQSRQTRPRFFATPAKFREWLAVHHGSARELWVGYYRKASGRPSITWSESVDEALCYGWIDGIRKTVDEQSYKVRFTPRKSKSTWSVANIARVKALRREGRMHPAGLTAFGRRTKKNSAVYSFENRDTAKLSEAEEKEFRGDPAGWEFFQAQPPGYRRLAAWWVISAKRAETRQNRLQRLIHQSRERKRVY
jgi:uncharacterized protein YdeI (YjbR/CyaY-like superfamily)